MASDGPEAQPSAGRAEGARIVVDAMGGDAPVEVRLAGAVRAAQIYPDVTVVLCGPEELLSGLVRGLGGPFANVAILDAPESIGMQESPVQALREKPRSSIAVGIEQVARGEADAFVSAGNTGAVTAASTLMLGCPKGVQRPGIAVPMKVIDHPVVTIDVGANVNCKPVHLLQYGIMATVFAREVLSIAEPRVGLLNVGEEMGKGHDLAKQAFALLSKADLNFVGNVEPDDFCRNGCDVLVCDGFAGNILLKFGESLTMRLMEWLQEQVAGRLRYKIGMALCYDLFRHLRHCADYTEYGGAPLLGVNGVTIITHGSSDALAIQNSVREARSFVKLRVNDKIEEAIERAPRPE